MTSRIVRAALATLALALATTSAVSAQERPANGNATGTQPRTNLADISDEVMCTVCGVPLELALEAPQAEAQRDFIRGLIADGRTKEEIKDALVAEYRENVLAVPGTEGFDLAAWAVPIAAFVTAALANGIALRRWRHANGSAEPPGDERRPAEAADVERLDADMKRYEL